MSTWKTAVGTFAALAGLLALLFMTGVVKIGTSSEDGATTDADEGGESEAEGKKGKGKGKGKKKKGKGKKKKGKKDDLDSLGYIGAVEIRPEDRKKVGVTTHEEAKVDGSLNLFNPCAWGKKYVKAAGGKVLREAQLVDMTGKVLHKWETTFASDTSRGWAIAKLTDNGDLIAVNARTGIAKLDWDSNVIWGLKGGFHHDFDFAPDGSIWVLYEKKREIEHEGEKVFILDNGFAVVSPEGELKAEHSFYDRFKDDEAWKAHLTKRIKRRKGKGDKGKQPEEEEEDDGEAHGRAMDLIHGNTLEFLPSDAKGKWNKGDVITSLREMDTLAVFDPKTMELKWRFGPGELDRPHDPSMLPDGNLMIFDNGMHRKYSRVLVVDPLADNKEVWSYRGNAKAPFFSNMRGLAQQLPNGNILVTSSQEGRAFEINREGEIFWEFWGTYVLGGKLRVPIRMIRLYGKPLEAAKKKLAETASG